MIATLFPEDFATPIVGGFVVAWCVAAARIALVVARMFQIEEYEAARLWAWSTARAWNWHRAIVAAALAGAGFGGAAIVTGRASWAACGGLLGGLLINALWRWMPPKKALIWTPRMRRLGATSLVVLAVVAAAAAFADLRGSATWAAVVTWALLFMATTIPVAAMIVANVLMAPVELGVRRGFVRRARRRMVEVDPSVVVITGSWGKTSTKHALAQLLDPAAAALPTPKSFNTLMGVTRTVNDSLQRSHRTFLVEADAYAVGEIADICALVGPEIAVVTAVGAQHLERFRDVAEIADALYEAVEALPDDGIAVIHGGEPRCAELATRARSEGRRVVTYTAEEGGDADVVASNIRVTAAGSEFRWTWAAESLEIDVTVSVLGRHQVENVSAALAVVHLLGYDVARAARRAAHLRPVPHRLQPVPSANGVVVIDDSYNANPVGVHNGLDVLAAMGDGKKILVTPGLVELGADEAPENRRYGEHAGNVCDHVIVMRARTTEALLDGLRAGGIHESDVDVVGSLAEATAIIGTLAEPGDVVLFANDLPDTYL